MKKSEMSAQNVEDRRMFVQHLASAGWDIEDWDAALHAGAKVDPEALATYAGPVFDLLLEYHAENRYLLLEMIEHQEVLVLRLRLHPRGSAEPLLAQIVETQDKLDEENYPELVKSLIPLCEPLLIETNEGLYQLSS